MPHLPAVRLSVSRASPVALPTVFKPGVAHLGHRAGNSMGNGMGILPAPLRVFSTLPQYISQLWLWGGVPAGHPHPIV